MANAASATQAESVKRRCENTRPARTNRFFTHCRGRIDTTIAGSITVTGGTRRVGGGGLGGGGGRDDPTARVRCSEAAGLHPGASDGTPRRRDGELCAAMHATGG